MTPATRGAIQALEHIAEKLSDTVNDDLAQMARYFARKLVEDAANEQPSDDALKLEAIRRILK